MDRCHIACRIPDNSHNRHAGVLYLLQPWCCHSCLCRQCRGCWRQAQGAQCRFCRLPADACAYGGFIPCIHIFRQRDNGGLYRRPCGEAGDGDAHIPASVISAWRCYADYLCQRPAWHFARHAHVLDCPCLLSVCRHSVHLYNGIYIGYGRLRYRA